MLKVMSLGGSAGDIWSLRHRFLRGVKMSKEEKSQAKELLNSEQVEYEERIIFRSHALKQDAIANSAGEDLERRIRDNVRKNKEVKNGDRNRNN